MMDSAKFSQEVLRKQFIGTTQTSSILLISPNTNNSLDIKEELQTQQLLELRKNDELGFSIGLEDDSNLFLWNVMFQGPEGTPYEGGFFKAQLKFPRDFPNNPPDMKFITQMWHPNIYPDGKVCISILHPPGEDKFNQFESADERWRPILGVDAILLSVISMLNDCNLDSIANIDAAKHMKEDPKGYKRKVRKLAQMSVEML